MYSRLVRENQIRVFFVGDTRYECKTSRYSHAVSTSSNHIARRNWLQHSVDKNRMNELRKEMEGLKEQNEGFLEKVGVRLGGY